MSEVLKKEQRDALFTKLREDPKLRSMIKQDWKAALKSLKIDPATVAKGTISRKEVENFANQRAGWEIIIVVFERGGLEKIRINEAVNFEAR